MEKREKFIKERHIKVIKRMAKLVVFNIMPENTSEEIAKVKENWVA